VRADEERRLREAAAVGSGKVAVFAGDLAALLEERDDAVAAARFHHYHKPEGWRRDCIAVPTKEEKAS
jgi:hypothetical protein